MANEMTPPADPKAELVARLRSGVLTTKTWAELATQRNGEAQEAADAIERLSAQLEEWREKYERVNGGYKGAEQRRMSAEGEVKGLRERVSAAESALTAGSALLAGERCGKDDRQAIYKKLCEAGRRLEGMKDAIAALRARAPAGSEPVYGKLKPIGYARKQELLQYQEFWMGYSTPPAAENGCAPVSLFSQDQVEEIVKQTIAASPAAAQGDGWVKCSERLPEIGTDCFVYTVEKFITQDCYDELHEAPVSFSSQTIPVGVGWLNHEFEEITHWMPALPPAPDAAQEG